ncbi:unnamed protein product [Haemonchus placei]|uniref:Uncharacterized protein n=1 Tax=Haemonchus placei TaxID=6290 RepID=A0A158QPX7_HAEPC|nr:unnamed protein product [Haemonchus placei]
MERGILRANDRNNEVNSKKTSTEARKRSTNSICLLSADDR